MSAICFSLDQSNILSSGNGLKTLTDSKLDMVTMLESCFETLETEKVKCWLTPFSPFPQIFSKALLLKTND